MSAPMTIQDYYEQALGQTLVPDQVGEAAVKCPWHNDTVESMSINVNTGLWKCFGCDLSGDIYTFVMYMEDTDFKGATKWLRKHGFVGDIDIVFVDDEPTQQATKKPNSDVVMPPIGQDIIDGLVENLWTNSEALRFLHEKRGLNDETIRQYKLGLRNGRITIPLFNNLGECYNIRQYNYGQRDSSKMMSWEQGRGRVTLFPHPFFWSEEPILLVEGEMDCLLALQLGFNAVTSTAGAGTWKREWNGLFAGRDVSILYDIDKAGTTGAAKVANNLDHVADAVRVLHLPITEPNGADITDWVVGYGATTDDVQSLIDQTVPRNLSLHSDDAEVYDVPLHEASLAKYTNKRIKTAAVVAGKDLEPYIVPNRFVVRCVPGGKKCVQCAIGSAGGTLEVSIPHDSPDLLSLKGLPDNMQKNKMKKIAGALGDCKCDIDVVDNVNLEDLVIIPELNWSDENQSYVTRHVTTVDHGIQAGKSYVFTGITVPDRSTQHATHLFYDKEWSQDDISSFQMDSELYDRLRVFQPSGGQSVRGKMDDIAADLSANVTAIQGRQDVHIAVDLCYHSPLRFNFDGRPVKRGWLELLLFGDTRTGKTETVQQMMHHYRLGEFVTGEASSYAGLVGGLQQVNKRWQITWGKIPLNDRRLVVIDEASGLTCEEIANMSGIRSSGVAEITKIQTERALARTRLIWISNPRWGDNVSSKTYPVEFIPQLIGKAEDISRFDLVVSSASDDVDPELINRTDESTVPHLYTSELCHELLMWAWSRSSKDILFSKSAKNEIYRLSVEMGNKYTTEIPLVESADFRVKLARMAAAWAARLFSTDDGERLLVKREHVEAAAGFVDECYGKRSFRYRQYSEARAKENEPLGATREDVMKWINSQPNVKQFLMMYDEFRRQDIEDYCGLAREDAAAVSQYLNGHHLTKMYRGGMRKTPMFIRLLEEMRGQ